MELLIMARKVDLMTPSVEATHAPLVVQAVRKAAQAMMPGDAEFWSAQ
jgi:hypothetical protein